MRSRSTGRRKPPTWTAVWPSYWCTRRATPPARARRHHRWRSGSRAVNLVAQRAVLDAGLEAAQVPEPDPAKDGRGDRPAGGAAHPTGEDQAFLPHEEGAARSQLQAEVARPA